MQTISILKTSNYHQDEIDSTISKHFTLLGLQDRIKPDMKVVIKPNLLMKRKPTEFSTTHPSLVEAIAKKLKSLGVTDVIIADSPGGPYNKQLLSGIYKETGMTAAADAGGAALNMDFSSKMVSFPEGVACKEFEIITPIVEADLIINVVKLKTHGMTTMSGAVKNLFGTVPGLKKPQLHYRFQDKERFSHMLLDLSLAVKPAITFVDAVDAMQGDGPSGGTKCHLGLTLASDHIYNLDLALSFLIGFKPDDVPTVKLAIERKLCVQDPKQLTFVGDTKEYGVKKVDPPKTKVMDFSTGRLAILKPILALFFDKRPVIRKKKCIGCGKCAESCPAKIIAIKDKKAIIDYKGCIRCYCCHEMCPVKAIDIR